MLFEILNRSDWFSALETDIRAAIMEFEKEDNDPPVSISGAWSFLDRVHGQRPGAAHTVVHFALLLAWTMAGADNWMANFPRSLCIESLMAILREKDSGPRLRLKSPTNHPTMDDVL